MLSGCQRKHPPKHPNILLIYADDLGFGDIESLNPDSKIPTPNIDNLAAQGKSFMDAHAAAAVCTPSRYALLTGEYPLRSKLGKGVLWTYSFPLMEAGQSTIATMLQKKDYYTALIGKWHLGFNWPTTQRLSQSEWNAMNEMEKERLLDFNQPITGGPNSFGFEYFFGMDTPNFPPYAFMQNDRLVGDLPVRVDSFSIAAAVPGLWQPGWSNQKILPRLEKEASDFIVKQAKNPDPFFLFLSLTAPHTPISPSDLYKGKSNAGAYGDLVVQVDDLVGKLMRKLDSLKLRDNTLIIFTSDNGSPGQFANDSDFGSIVEKYGHHPNGLLRGLKGDSWEAGHRVPFIVSWPGEIKPGTISHQMICQTDLYATLAVITGASVLGNSGIDSYAMWDIWSRNAADDYARDHLITQSSQGHLSIRAGDWKLILGKGSGGLTARIDPNDGKSEWDGQLFDLSSDLSEQKNEYGNPIHASKILELEALLNRVKTRPKHLD